jgi:cytoskeletal protein CcmA (bactofilin family)
MNSFSGNSSTILSDVEITGTITFTGELDFDGQLRNGDIIGETLIIGPRARIQGNIQAASLTLHGSVKGDVFVTGRCELKGSASLIGSLTTNRLAMDEGATLIGAAEITPDTKSRPAPPKPAPALGTSPAGAAPQKAQVR